MADYVKFSVPEDLKNLQADVVSKISKSGKVKVGINEVTKMVERNTAKLVLIAEDITPAEIVMHLPVICKEKNIAFSYVSTKEELGKISGINAKASAIAVVDEGVLKKEFSALISKIEELSGGKPKSESKPKPADKKSAEKKPVEKKEKPSENKKEEKPAEVKKEEVAEEKKE
ncbi:MAG TPA: 50S ribosomal protein L7Ae [Candidatus Diapherotrites archaeon]|nr:50S ribosomal protein L7Ae [Candidatus Diapherotrites archaeon]